MIIFLYGPDSYHRQKKEKEIVEQYQKKHSNLALEKFDLGEEGEVARLKDFLIAQSLFDNLKMAVARNLFLVEDQKDLIKVLQAQLENKNIYLVISVDNISSTRSARSRPLGEARPSWAAENNPAFLLKKPVIFQEFPLLVGKAWEKFVEQEIKKRNLNYPISDFQTLTTDCWGLINELDKLELLENQELRITNQEFKTDFFGSVQKLARGNFQEQLVTLENLLDNEDAAKVFNVLAYSVSATDQIKIADYDVAIKSGKIDYPEALLDFII